MSAMRGADLLHPGLRELRQLPCDPGRLPFVMSERSGRIAFFDFDGTLVVRESGVICAVPSIRRGLLRPGIGARLIATYALSKLGLRTRTDAQRVGFECY